MEELIKNMLKKQEKLGLTKKELAHQIGVSAATIRNWELGLTYPNLSNQIRIMKDFLHEDVAAWAVRVLKTKNSSSFDNYRERIEFLYKKVLVLCKAVDLTFSYVDHKEDISQGTNKREVEISDLVISHMKEKIHMRFNCLCEEDPAILYISTINGKSSLQQNESILYLDEDEEGVRDWYIQVSKDLIKVEENYFRLILEKVFF